MVAVGRCISQEHGDYEMAYLTKKYKNWFSIAHRGISIPFLLHCKDVRVCECTESK